MRVLSFLFLTGLMPALFAQAGLGSISGEVTDPTGALVANAKVSVANETNGVRRTLETNNSGLFSAPALPPAGGYEVTVEAPGFAKWSAKDITVRVGVNVDLRVALQVAATATEILVTANQEFTIDSAKSDVSEVIGTREIMELPINGRRFDSLALLTPGVSNDGIFGLVTFRGMALGNSFLTDGNDTTNQYYQEAPGRTRISSQISQDAVQEFQVVNAGYLPEFGRSSGGLVNTVTRSGTNATHGTFFWFFRNRSLNARDRYAAFNPPEVRHQTGGSVGGAIKKDKLFYFLNTEITRRHNPIASSITGAAINPGTRGFNGCAAPATTAQCAAADAIVARHFGQIDRRADQELFFAKLDYRPAEKHALTLSANYLRFISPNGIQTAAGLTNGSALGNNADSTVRVRYAKLGYTTTVSPTALNEFRFGWFKDRQFDSPGGLVLPPFGQVSLTVQGITNLGVGSAYPRMLPSEQRFQYADTFSLTHGGHQFKFGVDVSNTQDVTNQLNNGFGTFNYGSVTNFALDLTGNASLAKRWQTFTQVFGNPRTDITIRDYAFFAQDQYRVSKNLTVNYGLRYDYSALPQPTIINPDYPQTGRIPLFKGQLGPRIGLAYAMNNNKTVWRIGYGIFNQRYGGGIINNLFTQNGVYQRSVTYTGSVAADNAAGPVFPFPLSASDRPASGTVNVLFAGNDFRPNYTQNGDVSVEHQINSNMSLTVSYLYNRGFHIVTTRDLNLGPLGPNVTYRINDTAGTQVSTFTNQVYLLANRVDRRYSRVLQLEHGGRSWYDGMAVSFKGRAGKDITYNASYTWSHALDLGQGQGDDNINRFGNTVSLGNLYNGNNRLDKGSGALDQRHRLVLYWVAAHDFSSRGDLVSKYLLNGWQLSGTLTFSSQRPTFATVNIVSQVTRDDQGNTIALPFFSMNGFGGDTRVPFWENNAARLDGINKLDARITKRLPINERFNLALNFEAFNVTNSPWNTNIGSGTAHNAFNSTNGVLTPLPLYGVGTQSSASPDGTNARRAQVSLRLTF